jgi:hypothetical protein
MQEVRVTIKFITPCLGGVRRPDYDRFLRNNDGQIIFMGAWWQKLFEYGAKAYGRQQKLVRKIDVHPIIEGEPQRYRRFWTDTDFKEHEAFLIDSQIIVRMMLPSGLSVEDLRHIMDTAGQYQGISPYGWKHNFGRFTVVDVT